MFKSCRELLKDISIGRSSAVLKDIPIRPYSPHSRIKGKAATHIVSHRDRLNIFRQTLLDAAISNEFGFKEQDILPLFVKYQSKRQILIDIFSFLTYVVQLPTRFYLRRLQNRNFISRNNRDSDASRL